MEKGWDARGRLAPLWRELPGKRDELAERSGVKGPTLSAYNSGKRPLGYGNARKIAQALGVSLLDLGAPEATADEEYQTIDLRLELLAAQLAEAVEATAKMGRQVDRLQARLRILEARPWPAQDAATGTDG